MRVKCRGYEGKLIYLNADEVAVRNLFSYELIRHVPSYDISILTDDGARIELSCVGKNVIEVIHG